jgi:hypothetical protein
VCAPALAIALVLPLAGCPNRPVAQLPSTTTGTIRRDIDVSNAIDLLFVIDNSKSTQDKQAVFSENFPNFVQALDGFPTGARMYTSASSIRPSTSALVATQVVRTRTPLTMVSCRTPRASRCACR